MACHKMNCEVPGYQNEEAGNKALYERRDLCVFSNLNLYDAQWHHRRHGMPETGVKQCQPINILPAQIILWSLLYLYLFVHIYCFSDYAMSHKDGRI